MTDETDDLNRRTVLRGALVGASAVAGLGVAGTPVSADIRPGQGIIITLDNQSFVDACPNDGYGPIFEKGQRGIAWNTCTTEEGTKMILFQPHDHTQDRGWVGEEYIEQV